MSDVSLQLEMGKGLAGCCIVLLYIMPPSSTCSCIVTVWPRAALEGLRLPPRRPVPTQTISDYKTAIVLLDSSTVTSIVNLYCVLPIKVSVNTTRATSRRRAVAVLPRHLQFHDRCF